MQFPMTKRTKTYILIGFFFVFCVHTFLWFNFGKDKLFSQAIAQLEKSDNFKNSVKVNSFVRSGGQFVLCSNLLIPPTFEFLQSPTLLLNSETCSKTDTLYVLSENSLWQEKKLLENGDTLITDGGGIIVLHAIEKGKELFSAQTEIGFHLYGSDYYAMCAENRIWILNRWYSIKDESEGIGEIQGCLIEPPPTLPQNSQNL